MAGRRRRHKSGGFTLAELAVVVVLFSLFASAALAALNLALHYWKGVSREMTAARNARETTTTIASELRQGIPNPSAVGYTSLSPSVSSPTAVMEPNENQTTSTQLVFFEPHPTNYDLSSSTFSSTDPSNYRRVRYYVKGGEVHREMLSYNSLGGVTAREDAVVAEGDQIELSFTYRASDLFDIQVTATEAPGTEDRKVAALATRVHILGR